MPGTIIVTDYVFGDLDAECAALAEIGYELEQAPASVKDAAAVLVCLRPGVRGCRGVGEEDVRALTDREPRCPVNPEVLGRV